MREVGGTMEVIYMRSICPNDHRVINQVCLVSPTHCTVHNDLNECKEMACTSWKDLAIHASDY